MATPTSPAPPRQRGAATSTATISRALSDVSQYGFAFILVYGSLRTQALLFKAMLAGLVVAALCALPLARPPSLLRCLVAFAVNARFFSAIAARAFELTHSPESQSAPSVSYDRILAFASNSLYLSILLPTQASLMLLIHWALAPISFLIIPVEIILLAWLISYTSFDFLWASKLWPVRRRLEFFESRPLYFLVFGKGFMKSVDFFTIECKTGLPLSLAVLLPPPFIGSCLFVLLFPIHMIMANIARPQPKKAELVAAARMPVFGVAAWISDALVRVFFSRPPIPAVSTTPSLE
ncbi:hypothetical protein BC830DRAFT_1148390 [Chytriomyces sp. MP71]|nr:hypothetical protein BC830DRAFT_1148390 [Chytriomyces sp. MP71]